MAVSAALSGYGARAQDQAGIEEVVVTATKRAETLQEIPLSVTAFSSDDIDKRDFEGFNDYAKFVPGLSFGIREPGGTSIVFRGVASSGLQYGARPSSCVYLDETPITAAGRNPDPRLIDIERLEALRGPQGTLFGDSCQSGALRILTNKPNFDGFDSWVEAGGSKVEDGDYGFDVSAMANVPLTDTLAVRLVGFHGSEAGYVDNVLFPSPGGEFDNSGIVGDDVNTTRTSGGRIALRLEATPDLIFDATATFQDKNSDAFGDMNTFIGDLEQVRYKPEKLDEQWYLIALSMEAKLGWADALVTGSYFNREFRYDADAVDYQFFNFQELFDHTIYAIYDFGGDTQGAFAVTDNDTENVSFEARLSTPADSDSQWRGIVGVFYNKADNFSFFQSGNGPLAAGVPAFDYLNYLAYYIRYDVNAPLHNPNQAYPLAPTTNWYWATYDSTLEQFAIFGELNFDFTENFTITAGGRWYRVEEDRHTRIGALMQADFPDLTTDLVFNDNPAKSLETGFLPKASIEYRMTDDHLVYFTFSEGYRSGGGNTSRKDSIFAKGFSNFTSDLIINHELGVKTAWFDRTLQVNLAGYHMKWEDIQIQIEDPDPFLFQLGFVNFPQAKIDGFEMDVHWVPTDEWDLGGTLSYNKARISKSESLGEFDAVKGTPLPITPDWKFGFWVEYTFAMELLGAEPYARFDFTHTGESVSSLGGFEAAVVGVPPSPQVPYDVGDLSFGLTADMWEASFSIDNVWDERGEVFFNNRWGRQRLTFNQPRSFGFTFKRRFN
ncbi:MAG: TonB-dependent receptor [Gammaproteobacteria bacterium]|nr:TonB-dependent receptor [Gammaproteobacteria bacterium]